MEAGSLLDSWDVVASKVSAERMKERLDCLAAIGGSPDGGMNRLSYSDEDAAAHQLFSSWLRDIGLTVSVDAVGNLVGRSERLGTGDAPVMTGSHLDTQPSGGRYDGIAGCVAGLEVAEALAEAGVRPRRPLEVVVWAGEEGSGRFDLALIGSRAMVGALRPEDLNTVCRITGRTLKDLIASFGGDPSRLTTAERAPGSIHCVLELHVEQGPVLERAGLKIGVVQAISGNKRIPITFHGVQSHSGAMPMTYRRDALCAAAEFVLAVESAASESPDLPVVATCGYLKVNPGAVGVVPGRVDLIADVRSVDRDVINRVANRILDAADTISARRGVQHSRGPIWGVEPVRLAEGVVRLVDESCVDLGLSHVTMNSGAGHDSMIMAGRFPAGMIFVPSIDGISHAPEERTAIEDLYSGTLVLAQSVLRCAAEDLTAPTGGEVLDSQPECGAAS